jgi:hypothetical protein
MDILIDAHQLKNNNVQKRALDEQINDIIKNINSELKTARSNGENGIITELPIIFQIPGVNNKDSQRIIWSTVIEVLKKKNYNVILNHNKSNCRLKITMLNKEDDLKIKHQMDILANSTGSF